MSSIPPPPPPPSDPYTPSYGSQQPGAPIAPGTVPNYLAWSIIATVLSNEIVNMAGPTFPDRLRAMRRVVHSASAQQCPVRRCARSAFAPASTDA